MVRASAGGPGRSFGRKNPKDNIPPKNTSGGSRKQANGPLAKVPKSFGQGLGAPKGPTGGATRKTTRGFQVDA
jgi:hypothetical protein